jgi:hypothetical protein
MGLAVPGTMIVREDDVKVTMLNVALRFCNSLSSRKKHCALTGTALTRTREVSDV